ncbi:MAG TPA: LysR family transcriptional regulator [Alphaproteobacteria bacterium]|nr:LysR family transcriptional regulator [Alphaproteobacteria bacterium]
MRFDLPDLRLFLHVADEGSITRGASRAHLALASASERIREMEAALGVPLLTRGRRGVRLTPAGQALVHHARLMLEQHERMKGELGAYARGLKGHVRLLCNTAAMTEFLPDALGAYLAAHPNIDVDLEERPSYEIVQAVVQGLADVGIVADTVDLSDLQTFPFRIDRLVVVVPRRHALAKRRHVAFRDIVDRDFVGLSAGSALQDHLGQHAARSGRALKLRVRVRGFDAVCRMVERGVGIGIVPETAARRCRRGMAIDSVPLADAWSLRRLRICVRRLDALPAHAQQLVGHLRVNW